MLEASLQPHNAFVTLTYETDPVSLEPRHVRAFMKAFRKRVKSRVRFYAVGEYGEKNERPHYHIALFNHPTCSRPGRRKGECSCKGCTPIRLAWVDEKSRPRGFIVNLPLEEGSAQYIARYVVKKMTRTDDPRLGNRHPEFSRQSLGIGRGVVERIAAVIKRYNLLTPEGDVPVALRHGKKQMPLGRYLRQKLREHLGRDKRSIHVQTPEAAFKYFHSEENAEMRALQKAAQSDKNNPSLKAHVLAATKVARSQIEARHKMFNTKGKL